MTGKCGSPKDDVAAQVLCDRDSLYDPIGRIFDNEYCQVDSGCEPVILKFGNIRIRSQRGSRHIGIPAGQLDGHLFGCP
jgi:hypothetical protein